ncbi:MAG: NifB/NifX family molybdenum-iron cluster-binding protein [Candidatus Omnitrophica bacterium]|nr:NifB/NifX family molybdenum-iron cluster-binding protein [Candidatus Omnitrophota bacterium]
MKICITSQGNDLDSAVDPKFGRCQYFVFYDTDNLTSEFVENNNKDGMGGVGIQAGQLIADKGAQVLLTGNVGPNAYKTLNAGKVEVITGVSGKVIHVIDKYKHGEFKPASAPSVESHFGTK